MPCTVIIIFAVNRTSAIKIPRSCLFKLDKDKVMKMDFLYKIRFSSSSPLVFNTMEKIANIGTIKFAHRLFPVCDKVTNYDAIK